MKELSLLDVLVFFAIVAKSLITEIPLLDLLFFLLDILVHVPRLLLDIGLASLRIGEEQAIHYRNISNPLQQLTVSLLGYAFDRVHYRIGRLFLNAENCAKFMQWRYGKDLSFTRFVLQGSKGHDGVEVYQFPKHVKADKVLQVILYAHGGGLIVGSVPFYAEFLMELAAQCRDTIVLSPEYTLVPEACFPSQLNQIMALYKYARLNYPDARLILGGDSAGAGLCQSLLCALRGEAAVHIDRAFYISPWLDFTAQTEKIPGFGDYISPEAAKKYGAWYAPTDRLRSSHYGDAAMHASPMDYTTDELRQSCPKNGILVMAGGAECLLADSKHFVDRIADPSRVTLHVEPHEIHAYVLTNLYLRRGTRRFDGLNGILNFLSTGLLRGL